MTMDKETEKQALDRCSPCPFCDARLGFEDSILLGEEYYRHPTSECVLSDYGWPMFNRDDMGTKMKTLNEKFIAAWEARGRASGQQGVEIPDDVKVICPECCHQFRAIPVQVQRLMLDAGFEPPFLAASPQITSSAEKPEEVINNDRFKRAESLARKLAMEIDMASVKGLCYPPVDANKVYALCVAVCQLLRRGTDSADQPSDSVQGIAGGLSEAGAREKFFNMHPAYHDRDDEFKFFMEGFCLARRTRAIEPPGGT